MSKDELLLLTNLINALIDKKLSELHSALPPRNVETECNPGKAYGELMKYYEEQDGNKKPSINKGVNDE